MEIIKMIKLTSHSPKQTEAAGEVIGKRLKKGDVVALFGTMGMGKTAITRGICRGLGSSDAVSSPTFAIVNEYKGKDNKIYHFDMYRISGEEDLESTGFYEYLDDESNLIIEWSENIVEEIPEDAVYIHIEKGENENDRVISVGVMKEYGGR